MCICVYVYVSVCERERGERERSELVKPEKQVLLYLQTVAVAAYFSPSKRIVIVLYGKVKFSVGDRTIETTECQFHQP